MAIFLEHEGDELTISVDGEPNLINTREMKNLLSAFTMKSRDQNKVCLYVTISELVDSVTYIIESLQGLEIEINQSPEIHDSLNRFSQERRAITEYLSGTSQRAHAPIDELREGTSIRINRTLLDHQVNSLEKGLLLDHFAEFSVQGSGKTTTALATFSYWRLKNEISKMLVIGPLSSFQPWTDEISLNFQEPIQILRWSGSIQRRMRFVEEANRADVILCSYDTAVRDVEGLIRFLRNHDVFLILDESHYIKNVDSARANATQKLAPHASKRWIMTGTPAPYSLQDLWPQFQFLWPAAVEELLGHKQNFLSLADSPSSLPEIRSKLTPFFFRTTQKDLGLPDPEFHSQSLSDDYVPHEQSNLIKILEIKIAAEARDQLASIKDQELLDRWRKARMIRLLQAASNPALLLKSIGSLGPGVNDLDFRDMETEISRFALKDLISGKVRWTVDLTKKLVEQGEKVVIWTGWVDNIHYISKMLEELDIRPLTIYGAIRPTSRDENDVDEDSRENNIRRLKESPDYPVLIANPAAAAESISLHLVCHHAIYVDRNFNCGQWMQSRNRIHRVGLPSSVITHYWLPYIDCAVERSVDARLKARESTMYEFLGDDGTVVSIDWDGETDISDDSSETEAGFATIINQISIGNQSS